VAAKNKFSNARYETASGLVPQIESLSESEKASSMERDQLNKEASVYLEEAKENFEVSSLTQIISKQLQ
jgi:hypothetical protein